MEPTFEPDFFWFVLSGEAVGLEIGLGLGVASARFGVGLDVGDGETCSVGVGLGSAVKVASGVTFPPRFAKNTAATINPNIIIEASTAALDQPDLPASGTETRENDCCSEPST